MSTKTSLCIHGAAFQPIFPADFIELPSLAAQQARFVERGPSGSTFKAVPSSASFYVVVAAARILMDYLIQMTGVTLYYGTDSSTIRQIHVLDGARSLGDFNVNWSGSHAGNYDPTFNRLPFAGAPDVSRGLVLVLDVDFAVSQNPAISPLASITFASVIVDFSSGETWFAKLVRWLASVFGT
jgi:hypothetical protein